MTRRLLHVLDFVPTGTRTFDHLLLGLSERAVTEGWEVRLAFSGEPSPAFAESLAKLGVR